ncbi:transposase [Brucella oryzae]|uniref:transposase n=1 Tax=Brucella oryzae TaxID=335286 RepID=UPI001FDFF7F9|nr:transposase [Brucella oryzae]
MADEKITEANPPVAETKSGTRSTRTPKAAAKTEAASPSPAARKRTTYTPVQRASILASIEKATKDGKTTLKAALQQAEVSEQTYYNWKNAAAKIAPRPSTGWSSSDDFSTLAALEAENLKLRQELAAKLRAENEELRRRLGRD